LCSVRKDKNVPHDAKRKRERKSREGHPKDTRTELDTANLLIAPASQEQKAVRVEVTLL
jgi:hypothetical protein